MSAFSWAGKRGAQANQAFQQAKAQQEAAAKEKGKLYRFRLKAGEEARITFVDGFMVDDATNIGHKCLNFFAMHEHTVKVGGQWQNIICLQEFGQHCPIDDSGDKAKFTFYLTVIDHRSFPSQKEPGKIYSNQKRLFATSAHSTIQMLQKLAAANSGLAGMTFDVFRATDKDPAVGNMFVPVCKTPIQDLQPHFLEKDDKGNTVSYFTPADYEREVTVKTMEELYALGFGAAKYGNNAPAFHQAAPAGYPQAAPAKPTGFVPGGGASMGGVAAPFVPGGTPGVAPPGGGSTPPWAQGSAAKGGYSDTQTPPWESANKAGTANGEFAPPGETDYSDQL